MMYITNEYNINESLFTLFHKWIFITLFCDNIIFIVYILQHVCNTRCLRMIAKYFMWWYSGLNWHESKNRLPFAIFTIVNKILITKNCRILIFNNFLFKYYHQILYKKKTAIDKNCLFSFHRVLKIFSEFFSCW